MRSAQRARIAKAGVQPVGTAELILQETAADAEYNAIMAKYNANLKATAYNNTARARSREVFGAIGRGAAQYGTNEATFGRKAAPDPAPSIGASASNIPRQ